MIAASPHALAESPLRQLSSTWIMIDILPHIIASFRSIRENTGVSVQVIRQ